MVVTGWGGAAFAGLAGFVVLSAPSGSTTTGSRSSPPPGGSWTSGSAPRAHVDGRPAPPRLLRRRAGLARARGPSGRDRRRGARAGGGPLRGHVCRARPRARRAAGAGDGGGDAAQGPMGYAEFQVGLYARASSGSGSPTTSCSPCWPSPSTSWPTRNPSATRLGWPRTPSWPSARNSGSSARCSSTGPIRAGRTRTCVVSTVSGRGSVKLYGPRGRCFSRSGRSCSGRGGTERGFSPRLRLAGRRLTRRTTVTAAVAAALVLVFGGSSCTTRACCTRVTPPRADRSGGPNTSGTTNGRGPP